MQDLAQRALDTADARGATFADVRVIRRRDESLAVKSGRPDSVSLGESEGFGVRVLVNGAWGFASSGRMDAAEADRRLLRGFLGSSLVPAVRIGSFGFTGVTEH